MIPALPNPFDFSSVCPPQADKPAGAPPAPETAPAGGIFNPVDEFDRTVPSGVVDRRPSRFVLDEERFLLDIEPLPIFLQSER